MAIRDVQAKTTLNDTITSSGPKECVVHNGHKYELYEVEEKHTKADRWYAMQAIKLIGSGIAGLFSSQMKDTAAKTIKALKTGLEVKKQWTTDSTEGSTSEVSGSLLSNKLHKQNDFAKKISKATYLDAKRLFKHAGEDAQANPSVVLAAIEKGVPEAMEKIDNLEEFLEKHSESFAKGIIANAQIINKVYSTDEELLTLLNLLNEHKIFDKIKILSVEEMAVNKLHAVGLEILNHFEISDLSDTSEATLKSVIDWLYKKEPRQDSSKDENFARVYKTQLQSLNLTFPVKDIIDDYKPEFEGMITLTQQIFNDS